MQTATRFDRNAAFSRTIGWLTEAELEQLRKTRVAIAGMGGVGGAHLMTLTRLGVGRFSIADFDRFEVTNFNRQVGASIGNLDRPKVEVLSELARDVAPDLDLRVFDAPVDASNVDAFLEGTGIYVDGIDLFEMDTRRLVFRRCRELGIPAVTACPLGMGAATMAFDPRGMSFEEYFRLDGYPREQQILRFVMGMSPTALQRRAMVAGGGLDIEAERASSTPIGIQLASGIVATAVAQLVTGRGNVRYAPYATHFDAFSVRLRHTRRRGGNANLFQRIVLYFASRELLGRSI